MQPLPVDRLLPEILETLRRGNSLVLEAPPGTGKTTRVPRAILESGLAGDGEVLVLEPRRLAARMAARRVAQEMGERVGETVGYRVRFEEAAGPRTRLRYITEGLLARRLVAEPTLPGVAAVVLDEFHERHLHGDLALAFLSRLRAGARPDLRIVLMSATPDAGPAASFLDAPVLRSRGRLFDLAIEYLSPAEAADARVRPQERIARALRRLADDGLDGDVLVFLPGMAEIRRAMEACACVSAAVGLDLVPLHGDLPPEAQDRAVLPGPRRKVVFSTNVAETSVTIEGVTAVIDTGMARVASHSPWSGIPRLEVRKISRASAAQRAGRAGRTRPGRVLRLYTRHDHDTRPEHDLPEIVREDLAETLLLTAVLGVPDMDWLTPPPAAALEAARGLLLRLGAIDASGAPTATGLRMARFPLHPRLSRMLLAASARGEASLGALFAAILSERDLRERSPGDRRRAGSPSGSSDLLELASRFEEARRARFDPDSLRAMGISPGAATAVDRARRQLRGLMRAGEGDAPAPASHGEGRRGSDEEGCLLAVLAAFPDRVARRRTERSDEVVLSGGGSARLDPESVVRQAPLLVAVEVGERAGDGGTSGPSGTTVRIASAATPEMLLELFPDELRWEERLAWNGAAERVEGWERLTFGSLAIEETRKAGLDPEAAAAVLAEAAEAQGIRAFAPEGEIDRLFARLALVARVFPDAGIAPPGEAEALATLRELCAGRRSFEELRRADVAGALAGKLPPAKRAFLDRAAPERVALPGGRQLRVHYPGGAGEPWVESRLQDFFGMKEGPSVADGRVPLVLHLLAPNMRAVQVTRDLAGFWERHYPPLRRELMRRYPKHAWPQDPVAARPPSRGRTGG